MVPVTNKTLVQFLQVSMNGCKFNCTYCTIKKTRGAYEEVEPCVDEFLHHNDVLLIADSPSSEQVNTWCDIAITHNKKVSFRNLEPHIVVASADKLLDAAEYGVLDIIHTPVQSVIPSILVDMNRSIKDTWAAITFASMLQGYGVTTATNIIIDYKGDSNRAWLNNKVLDQAFHHVNWNPYWDGIWNRDKAQERATKYLGIK